MFGIGGGFILISPKLRGGLDHAWTVTAGAMNDYTPYSYVLAAIGIFALLTLSMHRSARR